MIMEGIGLASSPGHYTAVISNVVLEKWSIVIYGIVKLASLSSY